MVFSFYVFSEKKVFEPEWSPFEYIFIRLSCGRSLGEIFSNDLRALYLRRVIFN